MVYRDGLMPIIGRSLGPRSGRIGPLLLLLILVGGCRRAGGAESEIEQTYRSACGRCHGADGKGGFAPEGQNPPRNFCDAAFQRDRSDEQLALVIRSGKGSMPAFGNLFTDSELRGLVQKIRRFRPAQDTR